jgi:tetratricopeptide (TPR) repeat protein
MAASSSMIDDKIAKAQEFVDKGNASFGDKQVQQALMNYHFALLQVKGLEDAANQGANNPLASLGVAGKQKAKLSDAQRTQIRAVSVRAMQNMALCLLRTGKFERCIDVCTECLALDSDSVKAHYYRGSAFRRRMSPDSERALADLQRAKTLSDDAKVDAAAICREIDVVKRIVQREEQLQAKAFAGMFD